MRFYVLSNPRSASEYLQSILATHLDQRPLGELFHFHRDYEAIYHFDDGRIQPSQMRGPPISCDEFLTRVAERAHWLTEDRNVIFKVFGNDVGYPIAWRGRQRPLLDVLADLDYRPIVLLRRDTARHFRSYACMMVTGKSYHARNDHHVAAKPFYCRPALVDCFLGEQARLNRAVTMLMPHATIYADELSDPVADLAGLGFTATKAPDQFTPPPQTVYPSDDPFALFSNPNEVKQWLKIHD